MSLSKSRKQMFPAHFISSPVPKELQPGNPVGPGAATFRASERSEVPMNPISQCATIEKVDSREGWILG
jgi:hypothetical protein